MERDPNISILLDRLNALHERIAQTRANFDAHGPVGDGLERDLTTFSEGHDAIRQSIDQYQTISHEVISTAAAATDSLESRMKDWLQRLESRFNNPGRRRNPSVSM